MRPPKTNIQKVEFYFRGLDLQCEQKTINLLNIKFWNKSNIALQLSSWFRKLPIAYACDAGRWLKATADKLAAPTTKWKPSLRFWNREVKK